MAHETLERGAAKRRPESQTGPQSTCAIGKGIQIRGKITGAEDLVIAGRVEGSITIEQSLTIEASATVEADVSARDVEVRGELRGDIHAQGSVTVTSGARIVGDIHAARVVLEEGARFSGAIEMDVELPPSMGRGPRARA